MRSNTSFKFGNDEAPVSQEYVILHVVMWGKNENLHTDVVDTEIPLLYQNVQ